ncbi:NRAMP family divalent metal transporter [Geothrix sp. 21YS21S-4]|uniref:NRAMP family divalent metal transporter n=1 Tax=Geothrix sp. 21YS21S-4 TaxID=3068889 RepID=UPI0027B8CA4B|nr:divalent metal cation transporter [Geothrix sp. 21YS21S-4]
MNPPPVSRPSEAERKKGDGPWSWIGPGLVTGAADDDPSGIATYSQVGSRFGLGMLWTLVFSYPLMAGVQEISARLGLVTGRGLAANIRDKFPSPILITAILLLMVANTLNIAANIGAMAAALQMVAGGPQLVYVGGFGLVCLLLQLFIPYHSYVAILKWLCVSLFAYVAVLFAVKVPWLRVLRYSFLPWMRWSKDAVTAVVAVLGTTISPYLFFWQASEEVEEQELDPNAQPLKEAPEQGEIQLRRMRPQTWAGMAFSTLVAFAILLTGAVVLNAHGVRDIETTRQAAEALRPVAGRFAFLLFGLGVIGSGLLSVPVLAGSCAYAMAEARRWPMGLEKKAGRARRFYGVIAITTLGGTLLNFTGMDPMKGLFLSAVVNGVAAAPILGMLMLLTARADVMGEFTLPPWLKVLGWSATAVMAAVSLGLFAFMRP